ncbi:MAG: glycosyltransferase family 1 protein [Sedimenticolaceae bacterium]
MRLLLATDAWHPQINGVVTTLSKMVDEMRRRGHQVEVVASGDYPSVPLPSYPEIRLAVWLRGLRARIETFDPDAIHISTEGTIGRYVRHLCVKRGYVFTSSFHTRFPEYIRERVPVPLELTYPPLRRFHQRAFRTLVPTQSVKQSLMRWGFEHLEVWGRGVDTDLFSPQRAIESQWDGPVYLSVGRVAPEKNLISFLKLDLDGTKIVVGDGPQLNELKASYPDVIFAGAKQHEALAAYYASADVFVFPSLTDTFGLVMLEAISCGTPVAAFPVTGPMDVLVPGVTGVMHEDLGLAVQRAMMLDRRICREEAKKLGWGVIADQFIDALMPVNGDKVSAFRQVQRHSQPLAVQHVQSK